MAIHEHIRQDGEKELNATQWRYCGQPLRRVCRWALATGKRDISCRTGRRAGQLLVENLGYTFGFIIVIMARQQLLPKTP